MRCPITNKSMSKQDVFKEAIFFSLSRRRAWKIAGKVRIKYKHEKLMYNAKYTPKSVYINKKYGVLSEQITR